ncbi:MAG: hypothetical protein R3B56_14110 [Candidatus Scalinduaceae bacterium]
MVSVYATDRAAASGMICCYLAGLEVCFSEECFASLYSRQEQRDW